MAATSDAVPNPVQRGDAAILIGILAILEGAIWSGDLNHDTTQKIAKRFAEQGLLADRYDLSDLSQAIGDMNQRIRFAAGDYESPPPQFPLPS
jgi:hypothetical protein